MRTSLKIALGSGAVALMANEAHALSAKQLIHGGSYIGYTTIACSIFGLGVAIEQFVSVRREKLAPAAVVEEIERLLNEDRLDQAQDLCEQKDDFVATVLAAALPKAVHGFEAMQAAADDVAGELGVKMHMRVAWLSLVAAVAPMLGLLGTVWGMVGAFETVAASAAPEPKDFADDIALALITTVQGLLVAIPMMALFFMCKARVTRILLEMDAIVDDLLDRFRHTAK